MISWQKPAKHIFDSKKTTNFVNIYPKIDQKASINLVYNTDILLATNAIKQDNSNIKSSDYQLVIIDLPYFNDSTQIISDRKNIKTSKSLKEKRRSNSSIESAKDSCNSFFDGKINEYFESIRILFELTKGMISANGYFAVKYSGRFRHYLKGLLDNIFGLNKFVNEIYIQSPFSLEFTEPEQYTKEVHSSIFLYCNSLEHKIYPQYKEKKSGGYWHTMHSKGQGDQKIFTVNGQKQMLAPPPGNHWKFKQETIDRRSLEGTIRINTKGQPEYQVKESFYILDNNWLDTEAFEWTSLGWELNSKIYHRLVESFTAEKESILHIFSNSGICADVCSTQSRHYVGIDCRKLTMQFSKEKLESKLPMVLFNIYISQNQFNNGLDLFSKEEMSFPEDSTSQNTTLPKTKDLGLHLDWHKRVKEIPYFPLRLNELYLPKKNGTTPDDFTWKNTLIQGDNLFILQSLHNKFANQIKLIYIDPPFFTGSHEIIDIPIGVDDQNSIAIIKTPINMVAYNNIWTENNSTVSFSQWFYERVIIMHKLLHETGFMAVRFDYHFGHYAKMILDNVFGEQNFICEYLIRRMTKTVSDKAKMNQKHLIVQQDNLYLYRKSSTAKFCNKIKKKRRNNGDPIEIESQDNNIWLDIIGYEKNKKTFYPTENSLAILERLITQCSNEGDIVADFFAGSGTTLFAAEKLARRWIGADIGKFSINEIRKRMLSIDLKTNFPFQLLHLMISEQYFQKNVLNLTNGDSQFEKSYYQYILTCIGGNFIENNKFIQGKLENKYIYIGKLNSTISTDTIQIIVEYIKSLGSNELIILGWQYEINFEFYKETLQLHDNNQFRIELLLLPESLKYKSNEVHDFRHLPFIDVKIMSGQSSKTAEVIIQGFSASITRNKEKNKEIKRINSIDYLDFWAIDWNYQKGGHLDGQDFCSRKMKSLGRRIKKNVSPIASHQYEADGNYTILISAVDIYANKISVLFDISI